jgi:hypothetical protein
MSPPSRTSTRTPRLIHVLPQAPGMKLASHCDGLAALDEIWILVSVSYPLDLTPGIPRILTVSYRGNSVYSVSSEICKTFISCVRTCITTSYSQNLLSDGRVLLLANTTKITLVHMKLKSWNIDPEAVQDSSKSMCSDWSHDLGRMES